MKPMIKWILVQPMTVKKKEDWNPDEKHITGSIVETPKGKPFWCSERAKNFKLYQNNGNYKILKRAEFESNRRKDVRKNN